MQKEVYDFNRKMQQEIYYGFREKIESKKKRKKYLENRQKQIFWRFMLEEQILNKIIMDIPCRSL